jgi:hypothetical protein
MPAGGSQTITLPVSSTTIGTFTLNSSVSASNDANPANNGPVPTVLEVTRTCGQFNADKSRFNCGTEIFNSSAAASTNPSQAVCCQNSNINPNSAVDVSVGITGPASVNVGAVFDLTLTAKLEEGLEGAQNVTVSATLPAGLQLVSTPGELNCVLQPFAVYAGHLRFTITNECD